MERKVIYAQVKEGAASCEGFFQGPDASRVVLDKSSPHQVIVVDVIDLADVAVVQHFFNEAKFWLETRMPGGTFEDDEVFMFCSFFYEAIHLRAIYHKGLFDKDVFARPHR